MLTSNFSILSLMLWVFMVYTKSSTIIEVYLSTFMMISLSLLIDLMSLTFVMTVFFISSLVMMYSIDYMKGEHESKFMLTMILFIMFMVILCLSGNLIWVMIGWDGLGVTSFALIMFFQNWKSFNSAVVTFMCNRAGDLFILSSIAWLMSSSSLISWANDVPWFIQLMLIITALSKSAQIPFSSWLPLAMAAPTPVSSLVHSSTLVTAGVYLLIRFNSMLSDSMLTMLMLISSSTVILAGISALWEYDLKKVIALSTLSHIGLMMMMISINDEWPAMLHLVTHSMFKSLLFMSAGSIIHSTVNIQDIRFINSTDNSSNVIMTTSILSMMGLPFLSGYYSKEMMLMSSPLTNTSLFFCLSFFVAVALTCSYSIRLLVYLLSGNCQCFMLQHKEGSFMKYPMIMGCITSCMAGSAIMWDMVTAGEFNLNPSNGLILKTLLIMFMFIGLLLGYKALMINVGSLSVTLSSMMFINSFCYLTQKFFLSGSFNLMHLDIKGWTEYIISLNAKTVVCEYKDLVNRLVNQPIMFNNMMIKVCLLMMLVNLMIICM